MKQREVQASIGQRLLWLLHEYHGESGALNCPVVCRIEGPLDASVLSAAVVCLILRHESLRTTFIRRGHQLRQVIHDANEATVQHVDLSGASDTNAAVQRALNVELRTSIDPSQWPLRTTLLRLSREAHVFCLNIHHLVTDTWSCNVLQRELAMAYRQCQVGFPSLPPIGWQFSQFMAWQERQISGEGFRRHREYWLRQLKGACAPRLPFGVTQPRIAGKRANVEARIDSASAEQLQRIAAAYRATFFAVMLSCYYTLLFRLTGQPDLAAATLFANRTRPEVENTIGFLTNLVVLPIQLRDAATFAEVVERCRTTALNGLAHQELPYHVVSQGTSTNGSRLDEMVFQVLCEPFDKTFEAGDVVFRGMVPDVVGRFDFELALMQTTNGVMVKFYYTDNRVSAAWASEFIDAYVRTAAAVAANPHARLETLPVRMPSLGVPLTRRPVGG
jgi:hypothetical protein